MAVGVFHSVTALVAACSRQVSRMSKKLLGSGSPRSIDDRAKIAPSWAPYLSRHVSSIPFRGGNKKDSAGQQKGKKKTQRRTLEEEDYEDAEESSGEEERDKEEWGEGVWNKTILMGEKCQPLDFSGVICYDSEGRQLQELPPRSPMRSPLPSFTFPVVVASDEGGNY